MGKVTLELTRGVRATPRLARNRETRYLRGQVEDDDVSLIAFGETGKMIAAPAASGWKRERVRVLVQTVLAVSAGPGVFSCGGGVLQ
ncbi:hypothetical protein C266_12150 [Pandoraea sp. SD6-2]|nr:hypothetical protein C266_12150 [Pandoraea sp. SD6-2]